MIDSRKRTTSLGAPRFVSYLVAQFLGALNDNAYRVGVLFFALETAVSETERLAYSSLVAAIFAMPWLMFSPLAGYLADRYRKDRVLLATKAPEVLFMSLSVIGFAAESVPFLLFVFFLISAHAAFFSPAKYGMLPEIFEDEDLAAANGVLGMTTNVAILAGTALGGLLVAVRDQIGNIGWVYVAVAVAGTACSLYVPITPSGVPTTPWPADPLRQSLVDFRAVRAIPRLGSTVLGIMYFTFLSALLLTVVPVYCTDVLGLGADRAAAVLTALVIGVAVGSLGAGWLSRGRVEIGLVPLGALIMAVFSFDVAFFARQGTLDVGGVPARALADFALLGVGGGLFNIPLQAALQLQSPKHHKGQVIGFTNVAANLMILVAAALPLGLAGLTRVAGSASGTVAGLMVMLHAMTVVGAVYIFLRLPDYTARLVVYLLVTVLYRIRISGTHHIPPSGALLVANHVSWVDALVVTAASGRMVRFLMYRPIYETPGLHWLFKRLHVIPVAGGDDPARTAEALERARREIAAGHVVCIFAEGAITRTGQLLEFRRGLERIASGLEQPIVPAYLHGLWGSIFSHKGGRLLFKWPRRFRARVQVSFGAPLPSSSSSFEVRRAVQDLSVDAFEHDRERMDALGLELLRALRRSWRRPLIRERELGELRYADVLAASLALRDRALAALPEEERFVGVLLAPGPAAVLANLAVLFAGRVPVNLPADPPDAAKRALRAAGIRRVLGSAALWKQLGLDSSSELGAAVQWVPVELDAVRLAADRRWPWLRWCAARLLPSALAGRVLLRGELEDAGERAVVLFSRGAGSARKAVVLSHRNVLSNLLALREVFDVGPEDCVLCAAAFWHSIGFVGGLCLPIFAGARAAYHQDAYEPAGVAAAARHSGATLLLATPAALELYAQHVDPAAFASLRRVVTGGAPLPGDLRRRFRERFGVEPLEGYGCAECSPLISLNLPDLPDSVGAGQPANRSGTHGQPLPGVGVRIVDASTRAVLPPEVTGRIEVRGSNVLRGYLCDDGSESDPSDAQGWFDTGDLGSLDRAGFLTVVGRAGAPEAGRGTDEP